MRSRGQKGIFLKLDFQKAYDRLDSDFPRLVMQRRGFDDRSCIWIMQLVRSGKTAININGDVGPFFSSSAGVKQGDPIPPYSSISPWTLWQTSWTKLGGSTTSRELLVLGIEAEF